MIEVGAIAVGDDRERPCRVEHQFEMDRRSWVGRVERPTLDHAGFDAFDMAAHR